MKKKILILIVMALFMFGTVNAEDISKTYTKGDTKLEVSKISYFNYLIGNLKTVFAFVQPSQNVKAGDEVQFDSREFMDCGICDYARYRTQIDGYRIKVFNANGNLVEDNWFLNWELPSGGDAIVCGDYANFVYYYKVPQGAVSGNWMIKLEVAVSPSFPVLPECIVAQDEGSFTVGEDCDRKVEEVKYCVDVNTRYYKPANSCKVTYTNCDDVYGTGYKCLNGECQKVEECGDGICDDFENPYDCYDDCGKCGDKLCTGPETYENCPQDCFFCGDGICNAGEKLSCGADCANCGDGQCYWYEKKGEEYKCKEDCYPDEEECGKFDVFCQLKVWWQKQVKMLAILFSAVTFVFMLLFMKTYVKKEKLKPEWLYIILPTLIITAVIYFLITLFWWMILVTVGLYFFIPILLPMIRR